MSISATSLVKAIKSGGSLSRAAVVDYGLDSDPQLQSPRSVQSRFAILLL